MIRTCAEIICTLSASSHPLQLRRSSVKYRGVSRQAGPRFALIAPCWRGASPRSIVHLIPAQALTRASLLTAAFLLSGLSVFAKEKIKLMYLESEQETRAAVLINRLELPLEVHRIGIFRVGSSLYGVVRFGLADPSGTFADRHRAGTTTAMLCDRVFGEFPNLVRIDFEGVSQRETKTEKPQVLFSASIDRGIWKTVPKMTHGLERAEKAGTCFFDPRLEMGEPPKPKPLKKTKPPKDKTPPDKSKKPVEKTSTRDQRSNGESKKP